jgi:cell division protein ZapA
MTERRSVRVRILGEEYALRSDAEEAHTRAVAQHVDAVVRQIAASGVVIETHKAAILAALQIADELLRLRERDAERDAREQAQEERLRALAAEAARWLPPAKRRTSTPE